MRHYLTEEQKKKAIEFGKKRCEAKSTSIRYNDSNYHDYNSDRSHPHILGISAEIIYSEITGIPLDERILSHGDDSDFNGIEIKSATWLGDDIELKIKKKEYEKKSPIGYLLCRVDKDFNWVEFVGSIHRKRFDKIKYHKKHKFVENWCVESKDLTKRIPVINCDGKISFIDIENKEKVNAILSRD